MNKKRYSFGSTKTFKTIPQWKSIFFNYVNEIFLQLNCILLLKKIMKAFRLWRTDVLILQKYPMPILQIIITFSEIHNHYHNASGLGFLYCSINLKGNDILIFVCDFPENNHTRGGKEGIVAGIAAVVAGIKYGSFLYMKKKKKGCLKKKPAFFKRSAFKRHYKFCTVL